MHWPSAFKPSDELMPKGSDGKIAAGDTDYVDTYKAMEACYKKGKAKAIVGHATRIDSTIAYKWQGVSNFSRSEMERLIKETSVVSQTSTVLRWT